MAQRSPACEQSPAAISFPLRFRLRKRAQWKFVPQTRWVLAEKKQWDWIFSKERMEVGNTQAAVTFYALSV